ncbi:MAG TPA: hypothetical protein DF613_11045 [Lachnospiraceae bacterium]|nr:hypothetical protein [Lachnospiraceae bacterium]
MTKRIGILVLAAVIGMAAPIEEGIIPGQRAVMAAEPSDQGGTAGNSSDHAGTESAKTDPSGKQGAGGGKDADSAGMPIGKEAAGSSAGRAAAEPANGKDPDNAKTTDGSGGSDQKDTARSGSTVPSDSDGTGSDDGDMENFSAVTLKIDNRHLYDGMAKTYRKGYTPVVEDGKATLVLPLLADGELKDGRLTASLELGDPSGCPFVYRNYEKDVRLTEEEVDDGESTVKAYYVRFDLKLASGRTDGVYPVGIQIKAKDTEGNHVEQSFTTYVTIKGSPASKASDEPADDSGGSGGGGEPAEEKPTSQPVMLVEKVQVKGGVDGEAQAGSEFSVQVTLKNTSTKKSVQNMVVTASCETPGLTLLNETNTTYIESIGKGKTAELTLRYQAGADTPEGKYDIRLAMSYDNEKAETLTSEGVFSVTVRQPLMVEMTMPAIQAQVHAGDTLPLSFQFMNLGRSTVYNVRCELEGDGLVPGTVGFVGNMEAGTAQTADMNVFVDTLSGEELYGSTAGTVTLRYEDAAGKEYTQTFDFKTEIEKPVIQSVPAQQKEEKTAGQWWISVAVAGGLLLLVAAALFARRRYHEVV